MWQLGVHFFRSTIIIWNQFVTQKEIWFLEHFFHQFAKLECYQCNVNRKCHRESNYIVIYSKTCHKRPLKKKTNIGFQDRLTLNAGPKYCRMLRESILQYFWPSLSYHLSLISLFFLFLRGCFKQVLLYLVFHNKGKWLIALKIKELLKKFKFANQVPG